MTDWRRCLGSERELAVFLFYSSFQRCVQDAAICNNPFPYISKQQQEHNLTYALKPPIGF